MIKKLNDLLQAIKNESGIDSAIFLPSGAPAYRTADFKGCDFVPTDCYEIVQTESQVTVIPLNGGSQIILAGSGKSYLKCAEILRAVIENNYEEEFESLKPAEKLRAYLKGELDDVRKAELYADYSEPFDCYVLTLVTDSVQKAAELRSFLEVIRVPGDLIVPYEDKAVAFIKKCGEEDEYQSATDFACTLYDSVKEELRINFVINVGGTVHSFTELPEHFEHCALAYEFGKLLSPNGKVYSYKEYILMKILSDIPADALSRYRDTLLGKSGYDILEDDELMSTAEEFLKNSLNISETSRSMYVHRNTLIYRLDKIEKSTGLNLRHFNDAVAFRLLIAISKLTKCNKK